MITYGGKSSAQIIGEEQEKLFARNPAIPDDPIPTPTGTQDSLLNVFNDHSWWCEQLIDDMAALARKQDRLKAKLKDPKLENSPHRRAATFRYRDQTDELADYATRIAHLEAECDRYWQAMDDTTKQFSSAMWQHAPRLIGQAWRVIAPRFNWPDGYAIEITIFRTLDFYLKRDLQHVIGTEPVLLGREVDW